MNYRLQELVTRGFELEELFRQNERVPFDQFLKETNWSDFISELKLLSPIEQAACLLVMGGKRFWENVVNSCEALPNGIVHPLHKFLSNKEFDKASPPSGINDITEAYGYVENLLTIGRKLVLDGVATT